MKIIGTFTSFLSSLAKERMSSVVTPPARARLSASMMTGPSAVGSEKGIPSSMRSAPFLTASLMIFPVVSRSGSPQVMNGMNALP